MEWHLQRPDVVRATIGEMLADVYSRRDTAYAELWSLKNKIAWFEWAGLLAAVLIVCRGRACCSSPAPSAAS